jgi:hypothetical protein
MENTLASGGGFSKPVGAEIGIHDKVSSILLSDDLRGAGILQTAFSHFIKVAGNCTLHEGPSSEKFSILTCWTATLWISVDLARLQTNENVMNNNT